MEDRIKAGPVVNQQARRPPASLRPQRQWVRTVPSARIQWGRLTVDELLDTQGEPARLSALIQQRYGLTSSEADNDVAGFLDSCGNWF